MSRRDDVNKMYKIPSKISNIMKWLFWLNILFSGVIVIFNNKFNTNVVIIFQILISVIYVILGIIDDNFFWYNAENSRTKTSIENGFGIEITELKTEGYYNNHISDNIVKFSVNAFESILFSKTTAEKMIFKEGVITGIAIIVFISVCLIYKDYNIILIISQTVFSAYFIQDFIKLFVYKIRLEKLYDDFYKQLITIGIKCDEQRKLLLSYAIEYEIIKAYYKVRLSQKIFSKHNDKTTLEWDKICKKIKVNDINN